MSESLRDRINAQLKEAMKSQNKRRTATLRLVSAAIKDRDIQNRTAGRAEAMDDGEVSEILAKMIKQRRESAATYEKGGRADLAAGEREEIAVIEEFLPRQMSAEEVAAAVEAAVAELGCNGLKDMGKVMAALKQRHAGQMDFSQASRLVKARLSGQG